MTERELTIGLVEDNPGDARLIRKMLSEPQVVPFRVESLSRLAETLERVRREPFDTLLLDLGLPDSQGLATFDRVIRQAPTMPIIIFSGAIDEQLAVEAVARGAQDYLVKRSNRQLAAQTRHPLRHRTQASGTNPAAA
jgi:DNA-binding response OmpR family regulator